MTKVGQCGQKLDNVDCGQSGIIWTKVGQYDMDKIRQNRDNIDEIDKSWKVGQIIDRIGQYVYQF